MNQTTTNVTKIVLHHAVDDDIHLQQFTVQGELKLTPQETVDFLNADPGNAVVITGREVAGREVVFTDDKFVVVWRGAGQDLQNFYYEKYPLDDRLGMGGDLDAAAALDAALDYQANKI